MHLFKQIMKPVGVKYINSSKPWTNLLLSIRRLERNNESAAQIACFLLKAQYIEFRLKKLLELVHFSIEKHTLKLQVCSKISPKVTRKLMEKGLGTIIYELDKYKGGSIEKLLKLIKTSKLREKRNYYTHGIFLQKKEGDIILAKQAKEATNNLDIVLESINKVWKKIVIELPFNKKSF